jgi:Tol biopolymer transport system component
VKVLDFGLAKVVGGEATDQKITITEPGRVIGTPAYMSPEQARGQATDKRADIWSFGCVLYEMLTAKVPFRGETISDTLANILQTEPRWEALPENIPTNIRSLLRHCLKKDPRRRLQHIGDAAIEISEALSQPFRVSVESRPSRLAVWKIAALCALGGLAVGVIAMFLFMRGPIQLSEPRPAGRFIIYPETDLSKDALLFHLALALSPDGQRLAYVEEGSDGRRRIYLRELNEYEARLLLGTDGAVSPFFSPDGQWVGYCDHHQRKLKKVFLRGGEPITLADSIQFRGGNWGTDDMIIFTPNVLSYSEAGLWRISDSGDGLEQLTVPDPNQGEFGHIWPQILPGGKEVLFTNANRLSGLGIHDENQIEVYSLETSKRLVLFKGGTYARYVSTGHIVYYQKGTLYAVQFDIGQLEVLGSAFPVVPDVMTGGSGSAQFAISRDGSLAYIPVVSRSTELRPVWVDRQGQIDPLPAATPRNYGNVSISPDGTRLAFTVIAADSADVWIYDLTRDTLNPLTFDGVSGNPFWTPDGKFIMFGSLRSGKAQVFRQNIVGSGKQELLATLEKIGNPTSRSPDGKAFLFDLYEYDPNNPRWDGDIWVITFEGDEKYRYRPFTQRNHIQRYGVWSPNGRWIAYSSDESGRWEIYVEPYPGPGTKILISTEGGDHPVWSRDGKELFYRGGRDSPKMIAATIETEPEFRVMRSEELFENIRFQDYDVAPDGRFLMIQEPQEPTPIGINLVQNWFEELKRLAPTEDNQ